MSKRRALNPVKYCGDIIQRPLSRDCEPCEKLQGENGVLKSQLLAWEQWGREVKETLNSLVLDIEAGRWWTHEGLLRIMNTVPSTARAEVMERVIRAVIAERNAEMESLGCPHCSLRSIRLGGDAYCDDHEKIMEPIHKELYDALQAYEEVKGK